MLEAGENKRAIVNENTLVKRVLIYRLGSLGDTIVSLPSLHLIARSFPNAERWLLTNFPVQSKAAAAQVILDGSGLIHGYFRYSVGLRQLGKVLELRRTIKAWRPDVLIYLMPGRGIRVAKRDAMFFRACGIRRMIGVPSTMDMQQHRYRAETDLYEPEAGRLARCIAELGDAEVNNPASWDMHLTTAELAAAKVALEPAENRPVIAVSIGTKVPAKDWGAANWYALLQRMAVFYPGYALAILGAAEESAMSDEIASGWKAVAGAGPVLNLCGQLKPRESAAMVSYAELFVGHDSGPMHMASAVGTPLVTIFAARNVRGVWFPVVGNNAVIYHNVDCSGCALDLCTVQKMKCITSVTVEEVLGRVTGILPPKLLPVLPDNASTVTE
ncbi:MAG TPA: glycosyltransferase family 9 protein [Acidobacteriaceae bacterium]